MTSIDLLQIQNFILNHKNDTTFPNHLHWIPFLISHPNNSLLHLNTLRILSRDKSLISQNYDLWTNWLIWLSLEIDGFAGDELKDVLSIMNKLVV